MNICYDQVYIDETAHFDRERIPERVVHAKGSGLTWCFNWIAWNALRYWMPRYLRTWCIPIFIPVFFFFFITLFFFFWMTKTCKMYFRCLWILWGYSRHQQVLQSGYFLPSREKDSSRRPIFYCWRRKRFSWHCAWSSRIRCQILYWRRQLGSRWKQHTNFLHSWSHPLSKLHPYPKTQSGHPLESMSAWCWQLKGEKKA